MTVVAGELQAECLKSGYFERWHARVGCPILGVERVVPPDHINLICAIWKQCDPDPIVVVTEGILVRLVYWHQTRRRARVPTARHPYEIEGELIFTVKSPIGPLTITWHKRFLFVFFLNEFWVEGDPPKAENIPRSLQIKYVVVNLAERDSPFNVFIDTDVRWACKVG